MGEQSNEWLAVDVASVGRYLAKAEKLERWLVDYTSQVRNAVELIERWVYLSTS